MMSCVHEIFVDVMQLDIKAFFSVYGYFALEEVEDVAFVSL